MTNKGQQLRMKRLVERLFAKSCHLPVTGFEKELARAGFTQTGGDQIGLQFENRPVELALEILLDEKRCVHSYQILTFAEREEKQRKFRW